MKAFLQGLAGSFVGEWLAGLVGAFFIALGWIGPEKWMARLIEDLPAFVTPVLARAILVALGVVVLAYLAYLHRAFNRSTTKTSRNSSLEKAPEPDQHGPSQPVDTSRNVPDQAETQNADLRVKIIDREIELQSLLRDRSKFSIESFSNRCSVVCLQGGQDGYAFGEWNKKHEDEMYRLSSLKVDFTPSDHSYETTAELVKRYHDVCAGIEEANVILKRYQKQLDDDLAFLSAHEARDAEARERALKRGADSGVGGSASSPL